MKYSKAISLHKNGTLTKNIGSDLWTVESGFIWYLCYLKKEYYIEVEHGFKTDFGSIPRILWIFFDKTKYVSYILHDWLYNRPYVEMKTGGNAYRGKMITRKQCDLILIEGMYLEGANKLEIGLVYLGVRCFGWLFFQK